MSFAVVAAVAAPLVMGGISKIMNNKKAQGMQNDINAANGLINNILDNRENVYDASGKIRDMKSMVREKISFGYSVLTISKFRNLGNKPRGSLLRNNC